MRKRGQVTVFIILGIIILLSAVSFLFLKDYMVAQQIKQDETDVLELSLNAEKVKNNVNWCIDETAKTSIIMLGYYGGKDDLVGPFFDEEVFDANYLYYLGEEKTSSIEEMEITLSEMMNEHLSECVEDFNKLSQKNVNEEIVNHDLIFDSFRLETGEVDSSVVISKEIVSFNVNYPLQIKFKDKVKELNQFPSSKHNVNLHKMGTFLEEFMGRMQMNPQFVDMLYLLDQNYSIHTSVFSNDTYVFLFEDENSIIDYKPLTFLFSVEVNSTGVLI